MTEQFLTALGIDFELFCERAAQLEYEAGMTRAEAERRAFAELRQEAEIRHNSPYQTERD